MPLYRAPTPPEPPTRTRRRITLESRPVSTLLESVGVVLESRAYAPLQQEGAANQLDRGARVTIIGHVTDMDGIHEARRQARDVGLTDLVLLEDGGEDPGVLLTGSSRVVTETEPYTGLETDNESDDTSIPADDYDPTSVEVEVVETETYDPVGGETVTEVAVAEEGVVEPIYDDAGTELYGPPSPGGGDYETGEPDPEPVPTDELYGPPSPDGAPITEST